MIRILPRGSAAMSEQSPIYVPVARECVEVAGRLGIFLVLSVNPDEKWADLVALDGPSYLLSKVPFSLLKPYDRGFLPDG